MAAILETLRNEPEEHFPSGHTLIEEGSQTGVLYVLIEGAVEVIKDGIMVAKSVEPGAVFGDLSALLGMPHTAMVRTKSASRFHVVADARSFLKDHPPLCLHLCELLARRLDSVNKYLVDVKKQFVGHDHLAMVDEMLDTLMHRHPRTRIAPSASTLHEP
jgi:CRP-like cAMP-binding protein